MSSEQYFSYIQKENKFNKIWNHIEMRQGWAKRGTAFDCNWKSIESWRDEAFILMATMRLLFVEIYEKVLNAQGAWYSPNMLTTTNIVHE